ncbi:MAG: hypothetical protein QE271_00450 [Bacteriovoracaceae bacterium]|nr:hypothetical protein [Bacteriovoracaceae bacterium]
MKYFFIGATIMFSTAGHTKCDKTITCLLVVGTTKISTNEYTLGDCRRSAIETIGYDGYDKVKMKFWDEVNGKCIEETFER